MEGYVSALLREKGNNVYGVSPQISVRDAVREMNEKGVGALLVFEREHPVGIFTERDVLTRVVGAGLDPNTTFVNEVMTTDLIIVEPTMRVEEVMAVMTETRCRHLPVVDDGKVVGLVSIGDVTRYAGKNYESIIRSYEEYITGHPAR
jgi:CBS domain-containing protein